MTNYDKDRSLDAWSRVIHKMGRQPDAPTKFLRTCQECFHQQKDTEPEGEPSGVYLNRKCRECKSPALDYGSQQTQETKE